MEFLVNIPEFYVIIVFILVPWTLTLPIPNLICIALITRVLWEFLVNIPEFYLIIVFMLVSWTLTVPIPNLICIALITRVLWNFLSIFLSFAINVLMIVTWTAKPLTSTPDGDYADWKEIPSNYSQ